MIDILVITLSEDLERHAKLKKQHIQEGAVYHVCKPWSIGLNVRGLTLVGVILDNYKFDSLGAEAQNIVKHALITTLARRGLKQPSDLFTYANLPAGAKK